MVYIVFAAVTAAFLAAVIGFGERALLPALSLYGAVAITVIGMLWQKTDGSVGERVGLLLMRILALVVIAGVLALAASLVAMQFGFGR